MSLERPNGSEVPPEQSPEGYRAGNYQLGPDLVARRDALVAQKRDAIQVALLKRIGDIRAILDWKSGKGASVLLDTTGEVILGERVGIRRDVIVAGKLSEILGSVGTELGIRTDSGGTDAGAIGMSAIDTVLEDILNNRISAQQN